MPPSTRLSTTPTDLLRWWHQHQTQWLNHEAEAIRNGPLQDLLALRRQLELEAGDRQTCLGDMEQLYTTLESLGNRLSSPYGQDSLPMAIRHTLQPWQDQLPLQLDLPNPWPPEGAVEIALVISMLSYLAATIAACPTPPGHWGVSLYPRPQKQLTIQLSYPTPLPAQLLQVCQGQDWSYHLQTFELLTQGYIHHHRQPHQLTWRLTW
jgi:hypothetical protein